MSTTLYQLLSLLCDLTKLVNDVKMTMPEGGASGQYLMKTTSGIAWSTVDGGSSSISPDSPVIDFSSAPTLTSEDVGTIYRYTGTTNSEYENGNLYLAAKNSSNSKLYLEESEISNAIYAAISSMYGEMGSAYASMYGPTLTSHMAYSGFYKVPNDDNEYAVFMGEEASDYYINALIVSRSSTNGIVYTIGLLPKDYMLLRGADGNYGELSSLFYNSETSTWYTQSEMTELGMALTIQSRNSSGSAGSSSTSMPAISDINATLLNVNSWKLLIYGTGSEFDIDIDLHEDQTGSAYVLKKILINGDSINVISMNGTTLAIENGNVNIPSATWYYGIANAGVVNIYNEEYDNFKNGSYEGISDYVPTLKTLSTAIENLGSGDGINTVLLNNTMLSVTDGSVNIPAASESNYGAVLLASSISNDSSTVPTNAAVNTAIADVNSTITGLNPTNWGGIYCEATGTGTNRTATNANFKLIDGELVVVKFAAAVTDTSTTLNINSTGARAITDTINSTTKLAANTILANDICLFRCYRRSSSYYYCFITKLYSSSSDYLAKSLSGVANGLAILDSTGKVPSAMIPETSNDSPALNCLTFRAPKIESNNVAKLTIEFSTTSAFSSTTAYTMASNATMFNVFNGTSWTTIDSTSGILPAYSENEVIFLLNDTIKTTYNYFRWAWYDKDNTKGRTGSSRLDAASQIFDDTTLSISDVNTAITNALSNVTTIESFTKSSIYYTDGFTSSENGKVFRYDDATDSTYIHGELYLIKNGSAVKISLNGDIDVSSYSTHIADSSIHVTSTEKSTWNAKQNAITSSNKLDASLISGLQVSSDAIVDFNDGAKTWTSTDAASFYRYIGTTNSTYENGRVYYVATETSQGGKTYVITRAPDGYNYAHDEMIGTFTVGTHTTTVGGIEYPVYENGNGCYIFFTEFTGMVTGNYWAINTSYSNSTGMFDVLMWKGTNTWESAETTNANYIVTENEASSSTQYVAKKVVIPADMNDDIDVSSYDEHIADSSIHVTSTEKSTWNAKQDAITSSNKLNASYITGTLSTSNLPSIPSSKISDAATWNAKQNAITSSNKLDASLISGTLVTVDTALSETSTNPVQNKVIYAALGDIESALNALL